MLPRGQVGGIWMRRYVLAAIGAIALIAVAAVPFLLLWGERPAYARYRTQLQPTERVAAAQVPTATVPPSLTTAAAKKQAPKPVVRRRPTTSSSSSTRGRRKERTVKEFPAPYPFPSWDAYWEWVRLQEEEEAGY